MHDLIVYGIAPSTFVRSARLILEEKARPYHLEPVDFTAPDYRSLHPWAKIPSLRHGDLVLYETSAILHYADEAFDGPSFSPDSAQDRARMEQWNQRHQCLHGSDHDRSYIIERFAPAAFRRPSDEDLIAATLPEIDRQLGIVEDALVKQAFLAGARVSLADLLLAPILAYLNRLPESAPMVADRPKVSGWLEAMEARPSMQATVPDVLEQTAA